MTKAEARKRLETYPHHPYIKKFGYVMMFDEGRNKWVAGHEGDCSSVWYYWDGKEFIWIEGLGSKRIGKTTYYERICELANES